MTSWKLSTKSVVSALLIMLAVAVYRPLVVWAENPWDLAAPQELFLFSLVVLAIQTIGLLVLRSVGLSSLTSTAAASGSMLIAIHWHQVRILDPWLWLIGLLGLAAVLQLSERAPWISYLSWMAVAVLILAPIVQLGVRHVQRSDPYPIVDLAPRSTVDATNKVEDVLVLIVDSYPSLQLARDWFDHDPAELVSALTTSGFTVEEVGWSHNTFTGLAVPGLLELQPIAESGPIAAWGNRRSTYDLIRGQSLVATSLRSAGFEYTHIESGWEGAHCGHGVDNCLMASWFRETSWKLLEHSLLRSWLLTRYGNISVPGTKQTIAHLSSLRSRFDDGNKDFVFAHLLLPHAPIVVDQNCEVTPQSGVDRGNLDPEETEPEPTQEFASQLACVDSLLAEVVVLVGNRTAAIVTGDHGPGSGGQVQRSSETWSDADIAERFSVLLAHRLPNGCSQPRTDSNLEVMRAIVDCTVDIDLPPNNGGFLIGAENPKWVDPARMEAIKQRLSSGLIQPDES